MRVPNNTDIVGHETNVPSPGCDEDSPVMPPKLLGSLLLGPVMMLYLVTIAILAIPGQGSPAGEPGPSSYPVLDPSSPSSSSSLTSSDRAAHSPAMQDSNQARPGSAHLQQSEPRRQLHRAQSLPSRLDPSGPKLSQAHALLRHDDLAFKKALLHSTGWFPPARRDHIRATLRGATRAEIGGIRFELPWLPRYRKAYADDMLVAQARDQPMRSGKHPSSDSWFASHAGGCACLVRLPKVGTSRSEVQREGRWSTAVRRAYLHGSTEAGGWRSAWPRGYRTALSLPDGRARGCLMEHWTACTLT